VQEEGHMERSIYVFSSMVTLTAVVLMLHAMVIPAFALEINPCANDFKQYCSDFTPGGGRLVRCYEQYKEKMSGECKAWADGVKANAATLKEACAKDIDAGCNFEKGDPLGTLDCLEGNYIHLSPECVEALNKFKWRYPLPAK